MDLGPTELLIVLVIVVILFGGGRIAKLGGELGKGMREFRSGLAGEDENPADAKPAAPNTIQAPTHTDTVAK
jgi:sec-independent protein translocase protein TatA